jgi:integrase
MEQKDSSTIKLYKNCIKKLDDLNINYKNNININQLENDIKNIKSKSDKYIDTGRVRSYMNAVLWYFKQNKLDENIINELKSRIKDKRTNDEQKYDENKLNDKEKNVFLSWDLILNAYQSLYEKRLNSLNDFKRCITIGLYVLFPPRRIRDYSNMIVKKNTDDIDDENNYYIIFPPLFIFNDFKTKKRCEKIFDVSFELSKLLNEYIETYDLYDKKLIGLTENELSDKIKRIMDKLTNKSASINTFRHSYISYMQSNGNLKTTTQKKELASKMGHSHHTQQDIYVKYESDDE